MTGRPLTLGGVDVRRLLHNYRQGLSPHSSTSPVTPVEEKRSSAGGVWGKPMLLVSACLLGHSVSYRRHHCPPRLHTPAAFLLHYLANEHGLLTCIPICPEMDILNMPSPRPPIRLLQSHVQVGEEQRERKEQLYTYGNVTGQVEWGNELRERLTRRHPRVADELLLRKLAGIDGCVLKSRSPSCGVGDARVYASACGGSYTEADGFFVKERLRPVATGTTIPLVTERQLYFDDEEEETAGVSTTGESHHKNNYRYGVLSFIRDFLKRFETRGDVQS